MGIKSDFYDHDIYKGTVGLDQLYGNDDWYNTAKHRLSNKIHHVYYGYPENFGDRVEEYELNELDKLRARAQAEHPFQDDGVSWTTRRYVDMDKVLPGRVTSPVSNTILGGAIGGATGALGGHLLGKALPAHQAKLRRGGAVLGTLWGAGNDLYRAYKSNKNYGHISDEDVSRFLNNDKYLKMDDYGKPDYEWARRTYFDRKRV